VAEDDAAQPVIDWVKKVAPADLAAELLPAFAAG
jgi:hypothetical protein